MPTRKSTDVDTTLQHAGDDPRAPRGVEIADDDDVVQQLREAQLLADAQRGRIAELEAAALARPASGDAPLPSRGASSAPAAAPAAPAKGARAGARGGARTGKDKALADALPLPADPGSDSDGSDDGEYGGGGGGGGGGGPPSDESDFDDEVDDGDAGLFGAETLERAGFGTTGRYDGSLLGCPYDEANPHPRASALRERTKHYRASHAGDTVMAGIQDYLREDGKPALGEHLRRELSTHVPATSYLHDMDVVISQLTSRVVADSQCDRELILSTLAMLTQQTRCIGDFIMQRVDEIEQIALGNTTTVAQFTPLYDPQRLRSAFGASLRESGLTAEARALTGIAARERARSAAGAPRKPADGAAAKRAAAGAKLRAALRSGAGGAADGGRKQPAAKDAAAAKGGGAKGGGGGKGGGGKGGG